MFKRPCHSSALLILAALISSALMLPVPCRAADKALTEAEKIESLIATVEKMKDAKFIRNGSEYTAKNAAELMRYKWKKNKDEIKTAKDFITVAASKSKNSGDPYLIRFKDGKEVKSGEYLLAELEKVEKKEETKAAGE